MPVARLVSIGLSVLLLLTMAADTATGPSQVRWDRVLAEVGRYKTAVDTSGFAETLRHVDPRLDPLDLQAICRAKRDAPGRAAVRARADLAALGDWRDPVSDARRASLHRMLGVVASYQGDMTAAVAAFEAGQQVLRPYYAEYADLRPTRLFFEEALGVSHMRQGELENCVHAGSSDRCIFPLSVAAQHRKEGGSRAAIRHLTRYLDEKPEELEVRWLLNLAYMTLGRYPREVPKAQLIPPEAFRTQAESKRFLDVAPALGLARLDNAGGTIVDDFDDDGFLDVVLSSVDACEPLRYFRNNGDGTFSDRTEAAGLLAQLGGININQADYDNDGRLDIFVMRGGWEFAMRNSLLRNNGDGTFSDVTGPAGLLSGRHGTHHAAWADYDNDGWLDLFVGHELTPSQLFRNRGDGTFEDVTARAGLGATAFSKGAAWGDYDNDGFSDLYVSNMYGDNFLYRNRGDGTFEDVAKKLGVAGPFASFPTWFFDFDNDGWLDLFVASYPPSVEEVARGYLGLPHRAETLKLYRNQGDGSFRDVSDAVGLARVVPAMGANFGDFDGDGWLDMYLGTGTPAYAALMPNVMFKNDRGRRFLDVTSATGTGHLQKGHGVAFSDIDNDGDQDIFLNVGGAVPGDKYEDVLFKNPGGWGNHWVSLRLVGVKTNRAALGARITVTLQRPGGAVERRHREVSSGGSFGASSLTQNIGLGAAARILSLQVDWPASRTRQVFRNAEPNRFLEIREGEETYRVRPLRAFPLAGKTNAAGRSGAAR